MHVLPKNACWLDMPKMARFHSCNCQKMAWCLCTGFGRIFSISNCSGLEWPWKIAHGSYGLGPSFGLHGLPMAGSTFAGWLLGGLGLSGILGLGGLGGLGLHGLAWVGTSPLVDTFWDGIPPWCLAVGAVWKLVKLPHPHPWLPAILAHHWAWRWHHGTHALHGPSGLHGLHHFHGLCGLVALHGLDLLHGCHGLHGFHGLVGLHGLHAHGLGGSSWLGQNSHWVFLGLGWRSGRLGFLLDTWLQHAGCILYNGYEITLWTAIKLPLSLHAMQCQKNGPCPTWNGIANMACK